MEQYICKMLSIEFPQQQQYALCRTILNHLIEHCIRIDR